jgi:hypothetical protein
MDATHHPLGLLTVILRGWSFFVKLSGMMAILENLFTIVLISGVM